MVGSNFNEWNCIERSTVERPNIYPDLNIDPLNAIPLNEIPLSDQQHFRLNKITEIKDYFVPEIKERELMIKRPSKNSTFCDYFNKSLIVLSAPSGSISITSFAAVIGTPVGTASASLSLAFSLSTGIIKKLLKTTRDRKKKHNTNYYVG